jgi:hypothetical protein
MRVRWPDALIASTLGAAPFAHAQSMVLSF